MTTTERAVLSGELAEALDKILQRFDKIEEQQRSLEKRMDRWDGAITFIKAAAGFVGVGGLGLILAAIIEASGHTL